MRSTNMAYRLRATLRQPQPVILSRSVNWKTLTAVWAWGTELVTAAAEIRWPRSRCPADTLVRPDMAEAVYTEGGVCMEGVVCTEGIARCWVAGLFQAARSVPVPCPYPVRLLG